MKPSPPTLWRVHGSIRILRWVFLALYVSLLLAFGLFALLDDDYIPVVIAIGVAIVGQVVFIASAGTHDLCRPIRKRRVVTPIMIAAFMLALLVSGFMFSMFELIEPVTRGTPFSDDFILGLAFWSTVAGTWLFWGTILFVFALQWERFRFLSRVAVFLLLGSLAQLMATLPAHLYVINKRSGCLVGLMTGIGLTAGVAVMIWSFGPAIVLLFLYPRYRRERSLAPVYCETCGCDLRGSIVAGRKTCPDCRGPIPPGVIG